jgi:ABC-type multidrug transport system fused ATPase/permease subunit
MAFHLDRDADKMLLLLIVTDLLFVLFHVLHVYHDALGFFYDLNFSLAQEQGFAEVFQYIKEFWCTLLLLYLAWRVSNLLYFSWGLLFGYFLVDDSLAVHETLGQQLSQSLTSASVLGLDAQTFSELFVAGVFGVLLLVAIIGSYLLNDNQEARDFSQYLFTFLVMLIGFGVLMKLIQRLSDSRGWQFVLGMIEEGGEMLVMSVMLWFILRFEPTDDDV